MNRDQQHEREQLEAATSRAAGVAAQDAETAALRGGFVALGQALETAAADYDEAALIARLQASCAGDLQVAVPQPADRSAKLWQLVLTGALAASALFAIVRITISWSAGNVVAVAPAAPSGPDIAVQQETPVVDIEPDALAQSDAWDDPLDEEIVAAQDSLAELVGSPQTIDGALSNMNQTLEALADDLDGGSL
jgi:hypothetical protein